jgi:hypothetical protein
MEDLHDLRVGDLVVREMDDAGVISRHLGRVIHIRARIEYVDVDYDFREWWDVTSGRAGWSARPDDCPVRLIRAEPSREDDVDAPQARG